MNRRNIFYIVFYIVMAADSIKGIYASFVGDRELLFDSIKDMFINVGILAIYLLATGEFFNNKKDREGD